MKKLFLFFLLSLFIYACETFESEGISRKLSNRSIEDIGDIHNDILEHDISDFDTSGIEDGEEFLDSVQIVIIKGNLPSEFITSNTNQLLLRYRYWLIPDSFEHFWTLDSLPGWRSYLYNNGQLSSVENAFISRIVYSLNKRFNNEITDAALVDSISNFADLWENALDTLDTETDIIKNTLLIGESSSLFWSERNFLDDEGNTWNWWHDVAGALLGAAYSSYKQYKASGSIDGFEVAEDTLMGAIEGSIGGRVARGLKRFFFRNFLT